MGSARVDRLDALYLGWSNHLAMRLQREQVKRIVEIIRDTVPAASLCDIRLFGSRLDDQVRGGDVDIYVEVQGLDTAAAGLLRRSLRPRLEDAIDLPVDLVLGSREEPHSLVERIAKENGISLLAGGPPGHSDRRQ